MYNIFMTTQAVINRITEYEKILCEAEEILQNYTPDRHEELRGLINRLEAYYTSNEWRNDYEADEAGELPADLKRGVLSQDGIYNVLERFHELEEEPDAETGPACDTEKARKSLEYELFLWSRVRVVELADGSRVFTRARYVEDELFPELIVRGYNPENDCEEEYSLKCWSMADQKTKEEWREEYKKTGNSPAFSFSEIEQRVRGYRMELKNRLEEMRK